MLMLMLFNDDDGDYNEIGSYSCRVSVTFKHMMWMMMLVMTLVTL